MIIKFCPLMFCLSLSYYCPYLSLFLHPTMSSFPWFSFSTTHLLLFISPTQSYIRLIEKWHPDVKSKYGYLEPAEYAHVLSHSVFTICPLVCQ